MANWPASLPQVPISPGQQPPKYVPQANSVRSQVDAGPAKVRRRFTAVPEDVTIQMILSEAEMATLKDFIVNTLLYVLPFTWVDFRTNVAANYRLKNGQLPSEEHYGDDMWMVSLDLELLP